MPVTQLTYHPNQLLRTKLNHVNLSELVTPPIQRLIDNMIETMFAKNGIGIAANQVGKNLSIAIINTEDGPLVSVNPIIRRKSFRKETGEEGCLSVPGVFGNVRRHTSLVLECHDRMGKKISIKARGLFARVIQHEVDHLNGILCIDRMSSTTKGHLPDGRKPI